MPDLRISEFTPLTEVLNSDILPVVRVGPPNYFATKEIFLTAGTSEDIALQNFNAGGTCEVRCNGATGNVEANVEDGKAFTLSTTSSPDVFQVNDTGLSYDGGNFTVRINGSNHQIAWQFRYPQNWEISLNWFGASIWAGSPPDNVYDFIARLAVAYFNHFGAIP
jgi:hypothetical protein